MKLTKLMSVVLVVSIILCSLGLTAFATNTDEAISIPSATVSNISAAELEAGNAPDLTFALKFAADNATDEQLAFYGEWYADFVLTINKDVTFYSGLGEGVDGYLSGQYDEWSSNWVTVPFDKVTLNANEPLKIMDFAAQLMNKGGLKITYQEVYDYVKEFDCGVYFTPEFLAENSDLEVTLELRMYNPDDETESHVIGESFTFDNESVEETIDNINWKIENNILYVSGTGAIKDYASNNLAPWNEYSDSILGIVIEDGITSIGKLSFANLSKAKSVTIAPSVKAIKNYAFLNCSNLTTVTMSAVDSFGSYVFNKCDSLSTVNFAGTVAEYKSLASDILKALEFLRATTTITDEDGNVAHAGLSIYATWIYDEASALLEIGNAKSTDRAMLNYPNTAVIPWIDYINTVEKAVIKNVPNIGSRLTIGSSSLKELEIGEGVTSVNSWAFFNNTALENITLPASLTAIGTGAFYNVADVTITSAATYEQYSNITFGKSNEDFRRSTTILADATTGWHSGKVEWHLEGTKLIVTGTGDMASLTTQPWAEYADTITEIEIEDGITAIGKSAFAGFVNVTEITVPETVAKINAAAFDGMTGLTTVNLPASVISIGSYAFRDCDSLTTVNYNGTADEYASVKIGSGNSAITKATVITK